MQILIILPLHNDQRSPGLISHIAWGTCVQTNQTIVRQLCRMPGKNRNRLTPVITVRYSLLLSTVRANLLIDILNFSDLDECGTNSDDCDVNAVCNNTMGSYTCTCKPGYSGDGHKCYYGNFSEYTADHFRVLLTWNSYQHFWKEHIN